MIKDYSISKSYKENKIILEKAKSMIERSRTKEQLSTAKKFMELLVKDVDNPLTVYKLENLLLEKEKELNY